MFKSASLAQKLSWASKRGTTREEGRAYSLLGLLGINMPLLYREGRRAFQRLQLELLANTDDDSIFAWKEPEQTEVLSSVNRSPRLSSMLAASPDCFKEAAHIKCSTLPRTRLSTWSMTNQGLNITVYCEVKEKGSAREIVAILNCSETHGRKRLAVRLWSNQDTTEPADSGSIHCWRDREFSKEIDNHVAQIFLPLRLLIVRDPPGPLNSPKEESQVRVKISWKVYCPNMPNMLPAYCMWRSGVFGAVNKLAFRIDERDGAARASLMYYVGKERRRRFRCAWQGESLEHLPWAIRILLNPGYEAQPSTITIDVPLTFCVSNFPLTIGMQSGEDGFFAIILYIKDGMLEASISDASSILDRTRTAGLRWVTHRWTSFALQYSTASPKNR